MPTSVRLDPKTEAVVRRLARQKRRTKSEVIREAIARMGEGVSTPQPDTPYALIEDLIGIAHGGPPDLARRADEAFKDLLVRGRLSR
jgi:Ribbon-helix-helix protein, copG family